MKKYAILLFAVVSMFAANANVQGNKEKKGEKLTVEERVNKMSTDLNLTDAEKTAVKILFEKHDAEKKELSKSMDKKSDEFKAKMKELQKKQNDELKTAIGEEKHKKYKDMLLEERNKEKNKQTGQY